MEFLVGLIMVAFFFKMLGGMYRQSIFLKVIMGILSLIMKIFSGFSSFMLLGAKRNTYGSAEYLSEYNAGFSSEFNDGITLNGTTFINKEDSTQHILAVSPSGGGKTTNIIIPSIENISRHGSGSLIITDPSSELYFLCNKMLTNRGYSTYRIDLGDPDNSDTFNPILMANSSSAIDTLAKTLVLTAMGGMGKDPFWNLSSINLLSLLIKILKTLPPKKQTLGTLKEWITLISVETLREPIDKLAVNNLSTQDYNEYISFFAQTDKLIQSIISVCKSIMGNIYENVDKVTQSHSINLQELRQGKACIFICIPENQQKKFGFLLSLFYEMIFDFCYEMPNKNQSFNTIFMLLDEFANMEIQDMPTHITTLRKRSVSLTLIVQSFSQLRMKFGEDSETLIGNCKTKIFFPSLDTKTTNDISQSVGLTTYIIKQNPFNPFEKGTERSRQLIQPSEIRRLEENYVLVLYGRENPLKLKATPYYRNSSTVKELKG